MLGGVKKKKKEKKKTIKEKKMRLKDENIFFFRTNPQSQVWISNIQIGQCSG